MFTDGTTAVWQEDLETLTPYGTLGNGILPGNDDLSGDEDPDDGLSGDAGDDVLSGLDGNDTLAGGNGNDAPDADRITDFAPGEDASARSPSLFAAFAEEGDLPVSAVDFTTSAPGTAENERHDVIYNTTTGAFSNDANGAGSSAAIQFAALDNKPGLQAADSLVAG